jgi:hypothetical protein
MGVTGGGVLHEFITVHREEIIRRCRAKVAKRSTPPPTAAEIDHGVPLFLDQLVEELRGGESNTHTITKSAMAHGHDLLREGFTIGQVVHGYGDVCQSVTDLAVELVAPISTEDFRTLNRCLDDAIAGAVTEYDREHDESVGGEAADESARARHLVHELRMSIQRADVAFQVVKSGTVGIAGSTGTVLGQSISSAHDLIDRLTKVHDAGRRPEPAAIK